MVTFFVLIDCINLIGEQLNTSFLFKRNQYMQYNLVIQFHNQEYSETNNKNKIMNLKLS